MRILKIHVDKTVTEEDVDENEWMNSDPEISWDFLNLDTQHDIWVDSQAYNNPNMTLCHIKGNHVPLPAIITGFKGEETTDASITIEKLISLIK